MKKPAVFLVLSAVILMFFEPGIAIGEEKNSKELERDARTNFVNGMAIYQLTEKGLMLNADLSGTTYWLHDNLNE
mgnify:CR=1 FL=1